MLGTEGAFESMRQGAIFIDHTIASANIARELDREAKDRGFVVNRCAIVPGAVWSSECLDRTSENVERN